MRQTAAKVKNDTNACPASVNTDAGLLVTLRLQNADIGQRSILFIVVQSIPHHELIWTLHQHSHSHSWKVRCLSYFNFSYKHSPDCQGENAIKPRHNPHKESIKKALAELALESATCGMLTSPTNCSTFDTPIFWCWLPCASWKGSRRFDSLVIRH